MLPEQLLHLLVAGLGEGDLALLLVELEEALGLEQLLQLLLARASLAQLALDLAVLRHQLPDQVVERVVELGAVLDRAGDDERRARLVDQDRVHLVDDGVGVQRVRRRQEIVVRLRPEGVHAERGGEAPAQLLEFGARARRPRRLHRSRRPLAASMSL